MSNQASNTSFHPDFGPNNGGDLILCSVDNVDFNVHTVILTFASPVLADMFSLGNEKTRVNVGETAEILSLMLGFIYPRPAPTITSFETLDQGLHVADKYQLAGMKSYLRKELALRGSPVSAFSDPLQAYAVASSHGLAEETAIASSLISERYNLSQVDDLLKLAEAMPSSANTIKLVGVGSARMAILVDVLFRYNQEPMIIPKNVWKALLCADCRGSLPFRALHSLADQWRCRWAFWTFQELMTCPIAQCDDVFQVEFLKSALYKGPNCVPSVTCECYYLLLKPNPHFERWAKGVRDHLVERLKVLDKLNATTK